MAAPTLPGRATRQGRVAVLDDGEHGQPGQPGEPAGDLVVLPQHRGRPVDHHLRRAGDQPVEQGVLGRHLRLGVGAGRLDLPGLVQPQAAALDRGAAHVHDAGDPAVVGGLGQHLGQEDVRPPQPQQAVGPRLGPAGGVDHHRAATHGVEQPAPGGRVVLAPRGHRVGPGLQRGVSTRKPESGITVNAPRRRLRRHRLTDEARRPTQQNRRFQAPILPRRGPLSDGRPWKSTGDARPDRARPPAGAGAAGAAAPGTGLDGPLGRAPTSARGSGCRTLGRTGGPPGASKASKARATEVAGATAARPRAGRGRISGRPSTSRARMACCCDSMVSTVRISRRSSTTDRWISSMSSPAPACPRPHRPGTRPAPRDRAGR